MRYLVSLVLLFVTLPLAFGQMSSEDFKRKYGYDLVRQDKINVRFDNQTFWLRAATLQGKALRLTFFLKGDTPTTYTESLSFVQVFDGETISSFSGKLLDAMRPRLIKDPDQIDTEIHSPVLQRTLNLFSEDKTNNLFENTLIQLRQTPPGPIEAYIHTKRLKLSEVARDPNLPTKEAGAKAGEWIQALDQLQFTF